MGSAIGKLHDWLAKPITTPAAAAPADAVAAVNEWPAAPSRPASPPNVRSSPAPIEPAKSTGTAPAISVPIGTADQRAVCAALTTADTANICWLVEMAGVINAIRAADPAADIGLVRDGQGEFLPIADKVARLLRGLSEVTNPKYAAPILAAIARFRQAVEAVDAPAGWRSDRYEWPSGRD